MLEKTLAAPQGFEPRYADPESAVLPLNEGAELLSILTDTFGPVKLAIRVPWKTESSSSHIPKMGGLKLFQAERHYGLSPSLVNALRFCDQFRFQLLRIGFHLAGGNLFIAGARKAKLAYADSIFRTHRRAEHATGHRTMRVQIACPALRIEHRADFIVAETVKCVLLFVTFTKDARCKVTREPWLQTFGRLKHTSTQSRRSLRIAPFQIGHSGSQARCIKLVNGEDPYTALCATEPANQPLAASLDSIGQGCIHDMDQLMVARR